MKEVSEDPWTPESRLPLPAASAMPPSPYLQHGHITTRYNYSLGCSVLETFMHDLILLATLVHEGAPDQSRPRSCRPSENEQPPLSKHSAIRPV